MIEYSVSVEKKLIFEVDSEVFSPSGIDIGTLTMLEQVSFKENDLVLDLGCGYGFVGILAAESTSAENVTMVDNSEKAIELAKRNAKANGKEKIEVFLSDGLDNVQKSQFNWILSNPPYHVDFSVPKKFIHQSYKKLTLGGKLVMVTKRKDWYKNKLISIFGGVSITEKNGYYVFVAEKRKKKQKVKTSEKKTMSKKLERKSEKKKRRKGEKSMNKYLFTSESVTEGHPDKLAD